MFLCSGVGGSNKESYEIKVEFYDAVYVSVSIYSLLLLNCVLSNMLPGLEENVLGFSLY